MLIKNHKLGVVLAGSLGGKRHYLFVVASFLNSTFPLPFIAFVINIRTERQYCNANQDSNCLTIPGKSQPL